MPHPLPDPRDPLERMLRAMQISDSEMRVLLRDSAKEAAAIASAAGTGIGGQMRQAQLDIAQAQQQMWEKVGYQAQINIGDGVDAASDSASHAMEGYLASMGVGTVGMSQAMMMQGRQGIESLISRRTNGIPLSQQVYKTSVESGQQLDRTINAMILNGSSAREIASRVKGFIDPATPGGSSYAAMRLGRTELNNAFHETSLRLNRENPFVETMVWHLSGSHPRPDACNDYAEDEHFPGGDPGAFKPDDVPAKPHPNCLCYVAPEVVNDDEFVKNFKSGKYDSYLDEQLGMARDGPNILAGPPVSSISHEQARSMYSTVRKEMPGLQDSAYRREAARRLDVPYDDYLKAWKKSALKPAPDVLPPIPRPAPGPVIPDFKPIKPPVTPNIPTLPTLPTHLEARAMAKAVRKEYPTWSDAQIRRKAADRMNMKYKDYLSVWKKPTNADMKVPLQPHIPSDKQGWERKPANERAPNFPGSHTQANVGRDLEGINPHFQKGAGDYQTNCPSATSSFEMARRGNAVTTVPMPDGASIADIYSAWSIRLESQIVGSYTRAMLEVEKSAFWRNSPHGINWIDIPSLTAGLPNGARGFISVTWKGGKSAHIYNWEKIGGRIEYFDAQSKRILGDGIERFKKTSLDHQVYMARVDNLLTPSPSKLNWLVRNKNDADILKRDADIAKRAEAKMARHAKAIAKKTAEREANSYTSWAFDQLSAVEKRATGRLPGESWDKMLNRQARERSRVYYEGPKAKPGFDAMDSKEINDALSQAEKARISLERNQFKGSAAEAKDALTRYTEGSVVDMNMLKRDPIRYFNSIPKLGPHPSVAARMNHAGSERLIKDVERLEDLIKKNALDRDVTVARGVTTDMSHLKAGDLFADPAFLSTTTDLRMADNFATGRGGRMTRSGRKQEGWTFVMRAKRGTNAVAGAGYQSEIVFAPGLKQRIVSIDRIKRIIYSDVI